MQAGSALLMAAGIPAVTSGVNLVQREITALSYCKHLD